MQLCSTRSYCQVVIRLHSFLSPTIVSSVADRSKAVCDHHCAMEVHSALSILESLQPQAYTTRLRIHLLRCWNWSLLFSGCYEKPGALRKWSGYWKWEMFWQISRRETEKRLMSVVGNVKRKKVCIIELYTTRIPLWIIYITCIRFNKAKWIKWQAFHWLDCFEGKNLYTPLRTRWSTLFKRIFFYVIKIPHLLVLKPLIRIRKTCKTPMSSTMIHIADPNGFNETAYF
jgi:hypothetical protein